MDYWNALDVIRQVAAETGQPVPSTIVGGGDDVLTNQMLAALNAGGNELVLYYPWEQFRREWEFQSVIDVGAYDLPPGWKYFMNQTQWDRTNHWPMLGPKSAAEWAWLKGGLIASFPRVRFRVYNNKFQVWPTPTEDSAFRFAMEYMTGNWVQTTGDPEPDAAVVKADGDRCWFDPWLLVKYTKLKWLQLKNFDTTAAQADFLRIYEALKGKDEGGAVLSLVPLKTPFFIGPWSIPDGNWNV